MLYTELRRPSTPEQRSAKKLKTDSAYNLKLSPVDELWELVDPNPDIHALFRQFNRDYFCNAIRNVDLEWTKRLMQLAGAFRYQQKDESRLIALSEPLLKFRPRKDLVETLLHEMIHAYLSIMNKRDPESHGKNFDEQMLRINKLTGANIMIGHTFYDEVDYYLQHEWRCNGRCQYEVPEYGYFRRARNLPPSPADYWWADHAATCNGVFIKIREPEGYTSGTPNNLEDEVNEFYEPCGTFGPSPCSHCRIACISSSGSSFSGGNLWIHSAFLSSTTSVF
ncbi:DNA-dependent metalloprotease SPRTN-like [Paramacrobiotus metropolitanus]|uniref:DNA-dependent metalloprotease SPRTN-like n=1 Tax=Paramacrobiotus metropolitanus TaxID=2943436 RepID=UPI002446095D|nr:DNA-dependent metalloprotease SPRTN-like [Paramacrobiotus metropolitanus]